MSRHKTRTNARRNRYLLLPTTLHTDETIEILLSRGAKGRHAFCAYILSLSLSAANDSDGVIGRGSWIHIRATPAIARILCEEGLWERIEGTTAHRVVGWQQYQQKGSV